VVSGDPTRPGPFTAQLSLPDGYRLPPHTHRSEEHVEVLQGTFLVGIGDKFDLTRTLALAAGDTATAPAGMSHFAAARGPTIVAVTATGPYVLIYVHASDNPLRSFPYAN
jgi:quercetin dioxygenase-like cupin family protein